MTEDQGTDQSKRIGDYEVLGVLGAGGMGKVFKVRNVISDRIEAMKILLPDLEGRQELAERFLREIKLLAGLDHPNIAQLRTALTLSNRLVMVMEYVEGTTLAARLEQGPIPPGEALGYVAQVLNALSYAHAKSVIHRDIKPANMMLTPNGTIKLMDFGIARAKGDASMTVTGTTLGSLFYMSPEQVKGGTVDPRSDLYSLGVSLYEMVTGQLPFKAGSDYSIMTAQLQERPKPPSEVLPGLPPQLNGIILHSMAKEPPERFQSADDFRQALESIRQSIPAFVPAAASFAPAGVPAPSPTAVASTPTAATGAFAPVAMPSSSTMATPMPPLAAQPQPVPSVMDLSPKPSKGRGLYMALGAAVVLVVLVLAGISLPRLLKTRAAERQKSADQSAQPTAQPAAQDRTQPRLRLRRRLRPPMRAEPTLIQARRREAQPQMRPRLPTAPLRRQPMPARLRLPALPEPRRPPTPARRLAPLAPAVPPRCLQARRPKQKAKGKKENRAAVQALTRARPWQAQGEATLLPTLAKSPCKSSSRMSTRPPAAPLPLLKASTPCAIRSVRKA